MGRRRPAALDPLGQRTVRRRNCAPLPRPKIKAPGCRPSKPVPSGANHVYPSIRLAFRDPAGRADRQRADTGRHGPNTPDRAPDRRVAVSRNAALWTGHPADLRSTLYRLPWVPGFALQPEAGLLRGRAARRLRAQSLRGSPRGLSTHRHGCRGHPRRMARTGLLSGAD
jgi:hypothetical protein